MIKHFNELTVGQEIIMKGDTSSSYYGHKGIFEGMSTFFGADVAVINFCDPKPLDHTGVCVEKDLLFLHEIEICVGI